MISVNGYGVEGKTLMQGLLVTVDETNGFTGDTKWLTGSSFSSCARVLPIMQVLHFG
jgi:hypothetical protein